ncbi:MAG TPA: VOC family protein [Steroidobacteraceae bacterium]|nr:VOC family protein [Steroidobacteraceae bacterium]
MNFRATRDVIIRTPDFGEAVRFYESTLNLPIVHKSDTLVGFQAGALRLYVEKGPAHGPVFDFLVLDMPAAKSRLLSRGCSVVEEDASIPRCYIRDPHGLIFNIEARASQDNP